MKLSNKKFSGSVAARILWIWTFVLLLLPNICLLFTERVPAGEPWARISASFGFLLVPAAAYVALMTISRNVGKTVWTVFPLVFFSAFQMVLLDLFGCSVIAVDMWLNLVTTNASEAGELLGSMLPALMFVTMFYIPPLVMSVFAWRHDWRIGRNFVRNARLAACACGGIGLLLLCVVLVTQPRVKVRNDMYPVNVVYNACLAVERFEQTRNYKLTSAGFKFDARALRADSIGETYILVIGETARSDHFQLFGYEKETTPMLMGRRGLTGFRNTLSESNTTHKSVPMLLSHLDARTFGDSVYRVKGVAEAFREAGFRTAFFSNQQRNGSFIDFFGEQADTCVFLRDNFSGPAAHGPKDKDLLALVDSELHNVKARKRLVILHTYGSHFRYDDRYPASEEVFCVDGELEVSPHCRERLVAAYDNTIHYTASFLDMLINRLEADSTNCISGLVYASDHGEDIYDDGTGRFLHASPLPTVYQVGVPMLVWVSDRFRHMNPAMAGAVAENAEKGVSSTRSVFHTLLHMAGVEALPLDTTQSLLSRGYKAPQPQLYVNDHNRAVLLDEIMR